MTKSKYLDEYRRSSVMGASPVGLVVMLYDGALRYIDGARVALEQRNHFEKNAQIQKAQQVVSELMCCLDMERGGEIARSLLALYAYIYNQLIQANVSDDVAALDSSRHVLEQLRSAWSQIETTGPTSPPMELPDAS